MSNVARVLLRNAENGMLTTRAFASSPVDFRFSRTAFMETAALSMKYASLAPRLSASCEKVEHGPALYLKLNGAEDRFLNAVGGGTDYLRALDGDEFSSTRRSGNYSHVFLLGSETFLNEPVKFLRLFFAYFSRCP